MPQGNKRTLEERVVDAAEAALERQHYVSPVDVLVGISLLPMGNVEAWRRGRIDCLEEVIQGSPSKISRAMETFWRWAKQKGLEPSEAAYVRQTRGGTVDLRFSASGDPDIERVFRTHWVSPALTERKRQALEQRAAKPPEAVVFQILRESACSECGAELVEDSLLFMDGQEPLCLGCAGLEDLVFLPAGDTALTRRAGKGSSRKAVVVRFSRTRKRYERQGMLVELAALEAAERECESDAGDRARQRERAAAQRKVEDREFTDAFAQRVLELFPACPPAEARLIAAHAAARGSGRVGRTAAARRLEERPVTLAVVASVRHIHTNYDELLARGTDRATARERVAEKVELTLAAWREGTENDSQ
jgi:hypothetical protein